MFSRFLNGFLKRFGLLPIVLLIFLLHQLMTRKVKIAVANVPTNLLAALQKAMTNSPYRPHLDTWLAISKMETAGWTSSQYRMANNPWGMRPAKERQHSQDGIFSTSSNGDFAMYNSLDRAASDIVLYMQARRYPTMATDLLTFIEFMKSKTYFTELSAVEYYKRVLAWLNR
jgi:hypothetical protein